MSDTSTLAKALAERIRQQRLARGWTQSQMAQAASLHLMTYAHFEQTGHVRLSSLLAIFEALGMTAQIEQLATSPLPPVVAPKPRRRAFRGRAKKPA